MNSTRIKAGWKHLGDLAGVSFLILKKVRRDDSGLYQCAAGGTFGHFINVSVRGDGERNNCNVRSNETRRPPDSKPPVDLWLNAYFAAGIVAFVGVVVIIAVLWLRGCKGRSKKETQVENPVRQSCISNLHGPFLVSEQPFSDCGPPPPPKGSPCAPPCRRSTRRKTPPSHPIEPPRPPGGEHVCGRRREDGVRRGGAAGEQWGSVLYAALKHPPTPAAARPRRPSQEVSEYAAIRVQEPRLASLTPPSPFKGSPGNV
ncbi:uncharacterized protein btla isoform 2-T5 [Spinachia spinachia]